MRKLLFIVVAGLCVALTATLNVSVAQNSSDPAAQSQMGGASQPHMNSALEHLRQAQQELESASHDKGGHRSKALSLVKQALAEVEKGVEFDKTHMTGKERDNDKK